MPKITQTTEVKKWKDVEVDDVVLVKGDPWPVLANSKGKAKGTRDVVLANGKRKYPRTVPSKKEVEVRLPVDVKSIFANLARDAGVKKSTGDEWKPDPADVLYAREKGGKTPKAEKLIRKELGAVLVGEQAEEGGPFGCPPIDPSTIKSHLYLMHGVDRGEKLSLPFEDLERLHDEEHLRVKVEDGYRLPVNHFHSAKIAP